MECGPRVGVGGDPGQAGGSVHPALLPRTRGQVEGFAEHCHGSHEDCLGDDEGTQ